jgi:hypothetical protein
MSANGCRDRDSDVLEFLYGPATRRARRLAHDRREELGDSLLLWGTRAVPASNDKMTLTIGAMDVCAVIMAAPFGRTTRAGVTGLSVLQAAGVVQPQDPECPGAQCVVEARADALQHGGNSRRLCSTRCTRLPR